MPKASQPLLFTPTAYGDTTPRQEGEIAADRCAKKAERTTNWDAEKAAQWILDYLARHGATPGEVLTDECSKVYLPHDGRAFGAVFKRLAGEKKIKVVGTALRRKGHHCAGGRIWDLCDSAQGGKK